MHNFNKLEIWKRSRGLVVSIYKLVKAFPNDEKFTLTSQIKRCAISVPSNIAEGCGRGTNPQLIHFLDVAIGSLCELETQLYLAYDLSFVDEQTLNSVCNEIIEIRKMTLKLRSSL